MTREDQALRNATLAGLALLAGLGTLVSPEAMAQAGMAQGRGSSQQGAAAAPPATQAQEDLIDHVRTVRDLAAVCNPSWGGVQRLEAIAYCQGFLTAAGQYHSLLYPAGGPARPLYCVPSPGPTIAESGIAFSGWARQNAQYLSEPALDGFLRWAQANFPCPSEPQPARRTAPRNAR